MKKLSYAILALPLLLGAWAHAQTAGTITFTANKTSATGSLVPVLTWSTSPVASSCVASGAWSGNKFASGTETVAQITVNKSYSLTCSWGGGTAKVSWTAPNTNTDATALTDLVGYKVMYGNSAGALSQVQTINDSKATSTQINALGAGNWYFAVRSVNATQMESANSNVASKTITAATAAKSLAITVTPGTTPPPATPAGWKTVATAAYDVTRNSSGARAIGVPVGTIALGKPCQSKYRIYDFYQVTNADVTITKTPRSYTLVVKCAYK